MADLSNDDSSRRYFIDDDEETLSLMLSTEAKGDWTARLEGLEARFLLDHRGEGQPNHWEPLVRSVQDLGFNTSYEHHYVQNTLKADSPDPGTFPVAFASDDGKLHLKATASALQVSQTAAIQITLSAMRSLASSQSSNTKENQAEASFQSLLGTRIFLEKVLDYYLHQRVARIATMAECLRIEQRQDSDQTPVPASLSEMLDRLDKGSTHRTSNRGLFCLFLSIACRPEETPSLQRWLPCQSLRTVTTSNSQYSSQQRLSDDEGTWKQFLTHVLDLQRAAIQRERAEALEGLLVLLYERIANGVSRSDWALVLVGLQNMDSFFTGHRFQSYPRLPRVATLIAAECVGLWRVLESSWDPYSHPLLAELQSNTAQEELQALTLLMRKLATQAADRLRSSSALHEVPEALAVLPFAVLLRLTYQFMSNSNTSTLSSASSFCQTFADTSMELATVANDQCDALNYFYLVMEELVEAAPVPDPLSTTEDTMPSDSYAAYDQISGYSKEKVDGELTAQSLTYASIGREILGGIVMAFQDTILTIDTSMGSENIGVLCNLAAVVFRNSPILCAQFWNDWNVYTSPGSARYASPFCRVMDTAFTVASSAPAVTTHLSEVHALQAGWPLLRLVSSLVHSADVTEAALTSVLPLGFIRELLQLCTKPLDEALTWCRDVVFDSVHTLSRIGNSASCRTLLREALGNGMHFSLSGPRLLVKCSSLSGGDRTHTQIALGMLSYLSTDAPEEWILDVAASLRELQKNTKVQGSGSSAGENASTQARAEIVACLVRNMSRVMFCSKASEAQKLDFLCVIAENMQTLSAALSASLSSTSKQLFGGYILSYPTAKTIMDCLCNLLNHLRPILELHKLSSIKESALALRNCTITALVSNQGLGKAVMYYATAPVSLNLLLTLDSTVRDKPILQAMQETSAKQSILGIFAGEAGLSYPLMNPRVHQQLSDLLFHIEFLGFDPDTIQARGWLRSDPAKSLFEACASALRLLVQWARHAEDIAANGDVEWHEVGALGPSWLLVESASLPPDNRAATGLSETWVSSSIPNISLLLRYICKDEAKQIPVSVSALTFDLLVQSLEHSKMSLLEKSIPYEGILAFVNNSESFSRTLQGFVPNILRLYKDGGLGKVDLEVEVGQGLLGLQLYATCIDLGLSTASDENSESNPIATLGAIMSDTTDYLKRAGQSSAILPADHGAIDKLRIALESLKVLRSMHRRSETSSKDLDADAVANGWADYITHDDTILPSLVSLIFDQAKLQVTVVGREDDSVQHTKALIVGVTAVALDVLGLEFSRVEKRIERLDLQLPLFRALERCMEQDFSNLAMITKPFVLIRCFAPLPWGSSMESGSENGSYPPPPLSVLHLFSKGTCKPDRTEVGQKDSFDVFAACQWLSAAYLTCTRSSIKCYDTLMQAMLRYELFSSQIDRLVSWSKFTQSLVRVTRRWRCESTNSPLFLMNDEALSVSIITDVLSSVDENIDLVDVSPTSTIAHPRSYWHLERMAKASSDAILTLYCARKDKFSKGAFSNKFFRLLSATTKKMFEILRSRPKVACSICQNFAALAAAIVPEAEKIAASRDRPNSSPYIDPKVELAVTACKMIEAMVNVDIPDNGYQSNTMRLSCLHSSVTLLTTLVSSVHGRDGNVPQRSNISAESLSRTFVDHDVLRSLSQQLENMMSGSFSQSKVNERKDKSRANCTLPLAKAMLELLIALASSGNATMVSLLVSSKVLSWLSVLPSSMDSTTRSPSRSYHGYRADTQQSLKYESQSARATQEDPLHQVWMRTFILFAALVRSSSTIMLHGDTSPFHFCSIAIDFLKLNKSIVSSSLNLSSTFLVAPKSKPVTLAILRESASILFLFVELFGRDVINYFKNTEPDFYDWIVHKCSSLMINLSSFLGASASARELFQALLYFESASFPGNGMSHRPGPMSSSNRLLSDGFASAKHEAIRYSHFISQRYQAVSARELESERTVSNDERRNAVEGTVLESLAVQSLERTCRASVTSDFMSQLEFQAASCLLSAGTIIWRTHPASSSFVMLSDKEAFHLDSMSVVKVGMDIAFRNVSEMQTGAAAGKTGFGRVVDINTMDCVWEVVLLDLPEANSGANIFVRPHQLAGIEDTSKRTCMFAYKPAPGSSSELKMDDSSLSLGNIILGLRWCEQFYSKPISRQASESGWIAQRLAELLTALLGTEMSVRKITKMHDNSTNRHNGKILAAQLTDLYGEETDSDSNANSVDWMDKRGAGRLKGLLSQQTWTAIRKQLQSELRIARCDKETNRVAHPFC